MIKTIIVGFFILIALKFNSTCFSQGNANNEILIQEYQNTVPENIRKSSESYIISNVGKDFYEDYISFDDKASRISYHYRCMVVYNIKISDKPLINKIIVIQFKNCSKAIVDTLFSPVSINELSDCLKNPNRCNLPMDRNTAIEIAKKEGFKQGMKSWSVNLVLWGDVKGDYRWTITNTFNETNGSVITINAITGEVKYHVWSKEY